MTVLVVAIIDGKVNQLRFDYIVSLICANLSANFTGNGSSDTGLRLVTALDNRITLAIFQMHGQIIQENDRLYRWVI